MLQAQSEALHAKLRCMHFRLENADVPRRFSNLQALAPASHKGPCADFPSCADTPEPLCYQ